MPQIKRTGTPVKMREPAPVKAMPQWNNLPVQQRTMPVRMQEPAPVPAMQNSWDFGRNMNLQRTNPINAAMTTAIQNELSKLKQRQK